MMLLLFDSPVDSPVVVVVVVAGEASEQEGRQGRVQPPQRPGVRGQDESKGEGRGAHGMTVAVELSELFIFARTFSVR